MILFQRNGWAQQRFLWESQSGLCPQNAQLHSFFFTFNHRQQSKNTAAPVHPGEKDRKGTALTHSEQTSL